MQIIIATNNKGKRREMKDLFSSINISVQSLADFPDITDPPETTNTFDGNALQKAHFVFSHLLTSEKSCIVIADDSGLCVEALGGAPGVFSKRWTREETARANNQKLLAELLDKENRKAHFHCSMAIVTAEKEWVVQGQCHGEIAKTMMGSNGFGYDPLFIPTQFPDKTMAMLTAEEKNSISHRGKALEKVFAIIAENLSP